MSIEDARTGHSAVMAAIHRTAFSPAESWSRDVIALQLGLPTTFGLVHAGGGMILARVTADEAEILTLAVNPASRRTGIGTALLRAALARAAALGAGSMFLEVSVNNHSARGLYASLGFERAGLRRRYYSDGTDALILRSTITAPSRES